jgi:hypothetical protein
MSWQRNPAGSPAPSPAEGWEYCDFSTKLPPNATHWPNLYSTAPGVHPDPPVAAYRLIDAVVLSLVARMRAQGWQPAEAIDAISLWKAKRVQFRLQRRASIMALLTWQGPYDLVLMTITVRFKRPMPSSPASSSPGHVR